MAAIQEKAKITRRNSKFSNKKKYKNKSDNFK